MRLDRQHRLSATVLLFICALAAALVAPAGALAKGRPHHVSAELTVSGTNGYSLDIQEEGGAVRVLASDGAPPVATISATGGISPPNKGTVAATSYVTQGADDPNLVEADLGAFGEISVSFHPSGEVRVTKPRLSHQYAPCDVPRRVVRRLGTFSGSIRFRGENSYTSVEVASAPGSVGTSFQGCFPKIILGQIDHQPTLAASTHTTFLKAADGPRPLFLASSNETLGDDLFVFRSVRAVGGGDSFKFNDALNSVRITPPAPFSGSAILRHADKPSSSVWSGNLAVAFPGGMETPLTGSLFRAAFLDGRSLR